MPAAAAAPAEAKTTGRDVRVDRVGYVEDLVDLWCTPIRKAVKSKMVDGELDLLEGDVYEGKLVATTASCIPAAALYRLLKRGKIKEKDFLAAIGVSKSEASKFLSERELAAITESAEGTPRFSIARKKGIDVTLAQIIERVNQAATADLPA